MKESQRLEELESSLSLSKREKKSGGMKDKWRVHHDGDFINQVVLQNHGPSPWFDRANTWLGECHLVRGDDLLGSSKMMNGYQSNVCDLMRARELR